MQNLGSHCFSGKEQSPRSFRSHEARIRAKNDKKRQIKAAALYEPEESILAIIFPAANSLPMRYLGVKVSQNASSFKAEVELEILLFFIRLILLSVRT